MAKMHADEREIDEGLVRRLLAEQFPAWASLPLRRVEPAGTVNAVFRLGEGLSVRLPRRDGPAAPESKETRWLPHLAPRLPLEIPHPVAQGRPNPDYPWFWDIHTWVEGEVVAVESLDAVRAARDLAAFVAALQRVTLPGGPPGRGIPLAEHDADFRYWLARFDGDPRAQAVQAVWEAARAAPPWPGPPVWHHGDLDARNWLVRDGRIRGVIDWGEMGMGDPACDVMVAWKLHAPAARDAFREALPTDSATWARAQGWVALQAVGALVYYTPANNPVLYHEAQRWLAVLLGERAEIAGAADAMGGACGGPAPVVGRAVDLQPCGPGRAARGVFGYLAGTRSSGPRRPCSVHRAGAGFPEHLGHPPWLAAANPGRTRCPCRQRARCPSSQGTRAEAWAQSDSRPRGSPPRRCTGIWGR